MNPNLGSDLEIEILIHLPVKSLMRFKCVQKSWNILIKTPSFVRWYNLHNSNSHSFMFYQRSIHGSNPPYINLLSSSDLTRIDLCSLFPANNDQIHRIESYGNCNGVFFWKAFYSDTSLGHLILWNPTIQQVHLIPPAPSISFCDSSCDDSLYGFCAFNNDCTNNFKVVRLQQQRAHARKMIIPSNAEVYDLSTKLWTPVNQRPPCNQFPARYNPAYTPLVNCVYHWITTLNLHTISNILCFDFRNNQFHELKAPRLAVRHSSENIAEIKGSLAYVLEYRHPNPIQLEIWIMDESGWLKKYNIGQAEITSCRRDFWNFQLRNITLPSWGDDDKVFGGKVGELLSSYQDEGDSLSEFQIYIMSHYKLFSGCEYLQGITPLST